MDEFNYGEINEFCYKVFNYYNGRINKINYPAILFVEWANTNSTNRAGDCIQPNIVHVFPNIIIKDISAANGGINAKQNALQYLIIETIIHELYHIDQLLIFPTDFIGARDRVEKEVELQTTIYIANNYHEILEKFDTYSVVDSEDVKCAVQHGYASYHRRRFADHIVCNLKLMLFDEYKIASLEPIDNAIRKNIETCTGHIIVHAGDKSLVVQDGMYNTPIQDFNQFLYEHYFKYNISISGNIEVNNNPNGQLDIYINTVGRNIMCKLLKQ